MAAFVPFVGDLPFNTVESFILEAGTGLPYDPHPHPFSHRLSPTPLNF